MKKKLKVFGKCKHTACLLLCVALISGQLSPAALAMFNVVPVEIQAPEEIAPDNIVSDPEEVWPEYESPVLALSTPGIEPMSLGFEEIISYESRNRSDLQWFTNGVNNQYTIDTESGLRGLADFVSGNVTMTTVYLQDGEVFYEDYQPSTIDFAGRAVYLGDDIVLSGPWTPIGTSGKPFRGTFDGGYHTISGLSNDRGLFGYVEGHIKVGNAEIKNLMLTDVAVSGADNAGALLGSGVRATVSNVAVIGSVAGTGNNVGGIAGNLDDSSILRNSYYYDPDSRLPAACGAVKPEKTYTFGNATEDQFSNGAVAYLVDGGGTADREQVWTAGPGYPLFADSENRPVYRAEVTGSVENGSVTVGEYLKAGSTVSIIVKPDDGYILEKLLISYGMMAIGEAGRDITFTMPEYDVKISGIAFVERPEKDEFTVTFVLNGGNVGGNADDYIVTVENGEKVSPPNAVKDEYKLYRWYEDEDFMNECDFSSAVLADIRLYARWIKGLIVTFDLNDGGGSGASVPAQEGWKGLPITKPVVPELWPGYTAAENIILFGTRFLGWYTKRLGGELWDFENGVVPAEYEDAGLTLYAQWEEFDYFATGTTLEKPCKIPSAPVLNELRKRVNTGYSYKDRYFVLTGDIDLSGYSNWTPIGAYNSIADNNPFAGHFDGGGYGIKNLSITSTLAYRGLFGYMNGGSLRNLSVDGKISGGYSTGGILGFARGVERLENLTMRGTVTSSSSSSNTGVGGVAGHILPDKAGVSVSNCVNYASVQITGNAANLGGVVGYAQYNSAVGATAIAIRIIGCENHGHIGNTDSTGQSRGGIAGRFEVNGTIRSCTNTGVVEANASYLGGVAGSVGNDPSPLAQNTVTLNIEINDCINSGQIRNISLNSIATGGVIGVFTASGSSTLGIRRGWIGGC